jgi:hypothetical protein
MVGCGWEHDIRMIENKQDGIAFCGLIHLAQNRIDDFCKHNVGSSGFTKFCQFLE